ncbi:MAG: MBL fold metallo-hydrolase [Phycisphaerales bacterium]|nr:MBL fold metallo-hydrolase [Phycisphaerales bacterium]
MRFVFLGTGTSAGVPAIGCDCGVCTSADPRDRRLRTSAALRFVDPAGQERVLLIDAGPDLREQALRHNLRRVDAILFTHNHVDHTFGLDEVRRFNVVMRAPISVYADRHTLEHLLRVYRHIYERENNVNDSFVATLINHEIRPEQSINLFGLRITPIPLLHGRLPVLGYRFEPENAPALSPLPLAYCTDVSAIPPQSWRHFRGLSTLVLDALRHRKHPTHFTLQEAVNVADQIGAGRTFFVHMAHDLAHEKTNATLPAGMALAHDGLELSQ